jgi:hypothetical protein
MPMADKKIMKGRGERLVGRGAARAHAPREHAPHPCSRPIGGCVLRTARHPSLQHSGASAAMASPKRDRRPRGPDRNGAAAPPDDGHQGSFTLPGDTLVVERPEGEPHAHPDTNQSPLPERHREERRRSKRARRRASR